MKALKMSLASSLFSLAVLMMPFTARADIVVLKDPDAWMRQAIETIKEQRFDEFSRDFFRVIDKPYSEPFAASLRALGGAGNPVFIEKAADSRFGDVLRQVTWLGLYGQTNYVYFSFVFKKNRDGYAVTNFKFKTEPAHLFPEDYYTPD